MTTPDLALPIITVCTLLCDGKLYANKIFFKSLSRQDYPKENTRLLVIVDVDSPSSLEQAMEWKNQNTYLRQIDVIEYNKQRPANMGIMERYIHIGGMREVAICHYLALEPDAGMVFWDSDMDWGSNLLTELVRSGWGMCMGVYAVRGGENAAVYDYDYETGQQYCVQLGMIPHRISTNYSVGGGVFMARQLLQQFIDRGGYSDFVPSFGLGEDGWLSVSMKAQVYLVKNVTAWHYENSHEGVMFDMSTGTARILSRRSKTSEGQ